mmetsp:Transcript_3897/g.9227  ORF Transcript_3897/g.9227 Transcript_3897/m.9227 type:complete len:228 (-) Transcript_3897:7322-8005(-)
MHLFHNLSLDSVILGLDGRDDCVLELLHLVGDLGFDFVDLALDHVQLVLDLVLDLLDLAPHNVELSHERADVAAGPVKLVQNLAHVNLAIVHGATVEEGSGVANLRGNGRAGSVGIGGALHVAVDDVEAVLVEPGPLFARLHHPPNHPVGLDGLGGDVLHAGHHSSGRRLAQRRNVAGSVLDGAGGVSDSCLGLFCSGLGTVGKRGGGRLGSVHCGGSDSSRSLGRG